MVRKARNADQMRNTTARTGITTAGGTRPPNLRLRPKDHSRRATVNTGMRARRADVDMAEIRAQNIHHASLRIRLPRLRPPLRIPDARGTEPAVPDLCRLRTGKATVSVCRQHQRPFDRRSPDVAGRAVRNVRRSTRAGRLLGQLATYELARRPASQTPPLLSQCAVCSIRRLLARQRPCRPTAVRVPASKTLPTDRIRDRGRDASQSVLVELV